MTTTPGPWTITHSVGFRTGQSTGRMTVIGGKDNGPVTVADNIRNAVDANLIAVAPEMRDVLAAYLKTATDRDPNKDLAECDARARALLARIAWKE